MTDYTYVPTHLYCVERGYAGWPKFIANDKSKQEWLIDHVKLILIQYGPLSTAEVYDILGSKFDISFLELGCLYDGIYACVDRALRAADARQVWILPKEN